MFNKDGVAYKFNVNIKKAKMSNSNVSDSSISLNSPLQKPLLKIINFDEEEKTPANKFRFDDNKPTSPNNNLKLQHNNTQVF